MGMLKLQSEFFDIAAYVRIVWSSCRVKYFRIPGQSITVTIRNRMFNYHRQDGVFAR